MTKKEIKKKVKKALEEEIFRVAGHTIAEIGSKCREIFSEFIENPGDTINNLGKKLGKNHILESKPSGNDDQQRDETDSITEMDLQQKKSRSEEIKVENQITDCNGEKYGKNDSRIHSSPDSEEIPSDEDDKSFVDSISSEVLVSGIKGIATPGEALSVVDDLVKMTGEVEKFREAQKTKRTAIEAEKEVALAKLQVQKELLLEYLDKTFDERKQNFKKYFDVIDDALAKGNTQQLAMGLTSITELTKSSPFKDLANIDQVGKALEDKNHEWDF